MDILSQIFGKIMAYCYIFLGNYGLAIVMFTLLTKVILLPVSLWTQRNSIKMVEMLPDLNQVKIKYYGDKETIAEETQKLYKKHKYSPFTGIIPMFIQLILLIGVIGAVRDLLGESQSVLARIPYIIGGTTLLMPILAGLSALVLGLAQNKLNPLQKEQGRSEQIFTNGLSIVISLALGAFVPLGVGIYWICSNLFTILQQLVLNVIIKPEKYIDYAALTRSCAELAEIEGLSSGVSAEDKRREKEDYKRFFKIANKHLVFYSEKSGFYKYFQNLIEELLKRSNINIHYITSDPKDKIFELAKSEPRIRPYYIGEKKLITLMMKMDADMVLMTTPDLDNYYIKRSYVRKDIEYVYVHHGVTNSHMVARKGCLDNFDTIFCVGTHQIREVRETESRYNLLPKNLVECGYPLIDNAIVEYASIKKEKNVKPVIVIAPSWQENNILDSCFFELLDSVINLDYQFVLRPHPEYIKRYPGKMQLLCEKLEKYISSGLKLQTDFSENIFSADLLITDWSTVAYEYSFVTEKPSLFINTPMKVLNPDYVNYNQQPVDITWRNQIGLSVDLSEIKTITQVLPKMLGSTQEYANQIKNLRRGSFFNLGNSAKVECDYILDVLTKGSRKS